MAAAEAASGERRAANSNAPPLRFPIWQGHFASMPEPESWQNLQRLRAAEGWIELGLLDEARAELAELGTELRNGADGLEVQWLLFAERGHWAAAFEVAQQTVELHPDVEAGWIHRAYSARRRPGGGLILAEELLRPAAAQFPHSHVIPFNLACYATQRGHMEAAWVWLELAAKAGSWKQIIDMGLADTDLEPLWPRLRELTKPPE